MAVYYVDAVDGKAYNDGLSIDSAVADYKTLNLKAGDTVLFKRGTLIRGKLNTVEGEEGKPVTYAAYGEGEKPTFSASVNLSDKSLWKEEEKNIWVLTDESVGEAANFVYNGGEECGALRWTKAELSGQGDFFDNCFGMSTEEKPLPENHRIYLYSEKNPAEYYSDIECVVYGERVLADNGHDLVFKDLRFINSGVHAIAGLRKTRNMKVINCDFEHIGGAVWDAEKKIRFGNGVEMWDIGVNIKVLGCYFNDIYDSAVTQQGGAECEQADRFIIRDNVFINCGMGAYEQRDRIPTYAEFNDNICINAGEGFSKLGEIMPRYSEIWPQPMGHHVFLWRIDAEEKGYLEIKDNIFYNAPYGAAIYSIIAKESEDLTKLENNVYYTENSELLNRWNGVNFKSFEEYKEMEPGCRYEKIDIDAVLKAWKEKHV